jgi:hypothetical protein
MTNKSTMVEHKFSVPVLSYCEHRGVYPEGTTREEAISLYVAAYNKTAKKSQAHVQLIQGCIINFNLDWNRAE